MSDEVKAMEGYGRALLEKRARLCEDGAARSERDAKTCTAGGRRQRRHFRDADKLREQAAELRRRLTDASRYVWAITVGGGCGTFAVVGTAAYAEGRRAAKASWEAAPARAEMLRPARQDEADGHLDAESGESRVTLAGGDTWERGADGRWTLVGRAA